MRRIERLLKAETGLRVIASSDAEVRSKYLKYRDHSRFFRSPEPRLIC